MLHDVGLVVGVKALHSNNLSSKLAEVNITCFL